MTGEANMTNASATGRRSTSSLASIVVRSYNYGQFLRHAIDSALAQTYAPLEVVVVDDGSTDDSVEIILSYGQRITPVIQKNGGMAAALEAGFRATRGEVIVFLDSDDVLLPEALAEAVPLFADDTITKVHWQVAEIDAAGTLTGRVIPKTLPSGNLKADLIARGPTSADGPAMSGNAWARTFLEQVLPIPGPPGTLYADSYLHMTAALAGTVGAIHKPMTQYRWHGENSFSALSRLERLHKTIPMYHRRCRILTGALRELGISADPSQWKDGNEHYESMIRSRRFLEDLAALVPPGATYILVDEGASRRVALLSGRRALRFESQWGGHRGRPDDDEGALAELSRLRNAGAEMIVFVKPALWWLKSYPLLKTQLDRDCVCDVANDAIVAFTFTEKSGALQPLNQSTG